MNAAVLWTVLLALSLPFVTRWQAASEFGWQAFYETPLAVFTIGGLLVVAVVIARVDLWLGVFVAYLAAWSPWAGQPLAFSVALWVTIGAGLVVVVSQCEARWQPWVRVGLVSLGALQAVYALPQAFGYDPLWFGMRHAPTSAIHGTLGNPLHLGVLLAVIGSMAPWWLWGLFALGIILSHSWLAGLAFTIGLSWRGWWLVRQGSKVQAGAVLGSVIGVGLGLWIFRGINEWASITERWRAWRWALSQGVTLFGQGFGSWWIVTGPSHVRLEPSNPYYQAHNDYLQLLVEGGVTALLLLGLWLRAHRRMFFGRYGGSLVALALAAGGSFPFHFPALAGPLLVVVGLGLADS